jgi:hypothetical protein
LYQITLVCSIFILTFPLFYEYSIKSEGVFTEFIMSRTAIIILAVGIFVLGGIGITVFLLNQQQDTRSRAEAIPTPIAKAVLPTSTPTAAIPSPTKALIAANAASSCPALPAVTGVKVEYPGCQGAQCEFTQASCSWTASAGAVSYNVTVTEVETSTAIKTNESIPSGTTKIVFPITQKKTYKCDVVAVSSCGSLSVASSDQLLCEADAIISTPTPTIVVVPPTATPIPPTATPTPTKKPTPTIAKPGSVEQTFVIFGAVLAAIVGGVMLLAL